MNSPVIQVMYCLPEVAYQMHYWDEETEQIINKIKNNGGELLEYNYTTDKTVGMATQCLPSSFGHAPQNMAEKINSGY